MEGGARKDVQTQTNNFSELIEDYLEELTRTIVINIQPSDVGRSSSLVDFKLIFTRSFMKERIDLELK